MPSIDERVVAMAFENARFEQGVATTLRSLAKLDSVLQTIGSKNSLADIEKAANKVTLEQPMSALDKLRARFGNAGQGAAEGFNEIEKAGNKVTLEGPVQALNKVQSQTAMVGAQAADGFNEIERASGRVSLQGLTSALDTVTAKFSVMQGAAIVALGNITSQAAMKGAAFTKSFALGPITQGLEEYSTNLNSIQTILANTQGQRVSGLDEVNKHLQELNTYSDKTIYNFSQMAKNIGTFTAAGVDLDKSTQSIKGIANLAALSGSNSQQASTAMYQLSQAIAAGRVGLQDWNSVVNAGMGGAVFQKALMRTADNMGSIEKGALKIDKATGKATINGESFRNSIMAAPGKESWLTSDVLTTTLQQFTGDMTDAQLAAQGFNAEQIKAIQAQAKTAQQAATEVKTLPQVFDVAREAIGSGWANTFKLIFGDFNEAKKTFTDLSNFINGMISNSAKARNKMLDDWKKLGGRDVLIEGIKNAFTALQAVLKPIHDAFRDIFPAKTGRDLFNMTKGFADLMKRLEPSKAAVEGLRRTFRGLFSVLSIGWYVVKNVVGVIFDLLGIAGKGGAGFLSFTGSIGDFLTALQKAVVKGDALGGVFEGITGVLRIPLEIVKALASAFFGLFDGVDKGRTKGVADSIDDVGASLKPVKGILEGLARAWQKFVGFFKSDEVAGVLQTISDAFKAVAATIKNALDGLDFGNAVSVLQAGLLGGILVTIKKFFSGVDDAISSPLGHVNDILKGLTANLQAMERGIQAATLAAIAAAIVTLAAGVFLLSKIEPAPLEQAMSAVAIGLGQLVAAFAILSKASKGGAFLTMPVISASLIGLASAVTILAAAVKIFSTMSWDELTRGLAGVGGALVAVSVGVKTMGPSVILIGPGLLAVAVAMNALAVAMKIFSGFKWEELAKGVAGIAGSLVALGVGLEGIGPSILLVGPGLIAAGVGLAMLSGAVASFGSQDLLKMIQGVIGMAGALTVLSEAMWRTPPGPMLAGQAAGLVILAVALTGIAGAVKIMGGLNLPTLAKGLTALGVALFEFSVGLELMTGTLPGSLALLAAAAALTLLVPTLGLLGSLKWETIGKGLAAIAASLVVLSVIGAVASSGLLALGIALTALGVAVILVGTGFLALAAGFKLIGESGTKAVAVMIAAITAFVVALPKLVIDLVKGLVEVVAQVAKIAPQVADSLVKIATTLIDTVIRLAPKVAEAIGALIQQLLVVIVRDSPKLIQAGVTLILNLLRGIDQNIGEITNRVASIITKFLSALAARAPALTAAGAHALTAFLSGVASHIQGVVAAGAKVVVNFLKGIAKAVPGVVGGVVKLIVKFVDAVGDNLPKIANAGVRLAGKFIRTVASSLIKLVDIALDAVIKFMNLLAESIEEHADDFVEAGFKIGAAIVKGVLKGMADLRQNAEDALSEAAFHNKARERADMRGQAFAAAARGTPRHLLEGLYPDDLLDEAFKARGKHHGKKAHKAGREISHKLAEGVKEGGKKEIGPALDVGLEPLKKPVAVKPLDTRPLKKSAAEVEATANQVVGSSQKVAAEAEKTAKKVGPLGIKMGEHMVNGLKMGLRMIGPVMASGVFGPIGAMLAQTKSMREFGKFMGGEFRKGLTGGLWDDGKSDAQRQIADAFKSLRAKLGEENGKLHDSIKSDQDKLKQLMGERDKDWGKINGLRARIAQERYLLASSRDSSAALMRFMAGEQSILQKLAANYEKVSQKLENAKSKLAGLKDDRKSAIQQYADQFGQLPDIGQLIDAAASDAAMTWAERWDALRKKQQDDQKRSQIDQVALYKKSLQEQITATLKYTETLGQLRKLGLDDATYKKLLDMGVAGQEFASQLLRGGKGSIDQINALDTQLKSASGDLGKTAANELYNAGIAAAQGLVDGLKKDRAKIREAMTEIAKTLVSSLKLALGIRSPSRAFAELGVFSVQGLAEGLVNSSGLVQSAASGIGDDAADALTKSLANISDRIQNGIDTDLTITPVLDLTQVERDASKMQDLTNVVPITAAASYGQAAAISSETQEQAAAQAEAAAQPNVELKFEQNNTSPKALDDIEIYRQTKNGISQVKSALGLVTQTKP